MTNIILSDIKNFINLKLLKAEDINVLQGVQKVCVSEISPNSMGLVDALDVKPWMVYAPIAKDWEAYNKEDNKGELTKSKL